MPDGEPAAAPVHAPDEDKGTRYRPEYADQARRLCLLGSSDKDLAEVFGVKNVKSIERWCQRYPEFAAACRLGRQEADGLVIEAVFNAATGHHKTTQRAVSCGKGEVQVVEVKEYVKPDMKAAELWSERKKLRDAKAQADAEAAKAQAGSAESVREKLFERINNLVERIGQGPESPPQSVYGMCRGVHPIDSDDNYLTPDQIRAHLNWESAKKAEIAARELLYAADAQAKASREAGHVYDPTKPGALPPPVQQVVAPAAAEPYEPEVEVLPPKQRVQFPSMHRSKPLPPTPPPRVHPNHPDQRAAFARAFGLNK